MSDCTVSCGNDNSLLEVGCCVDDNGAADKDHGRIANLRLGWVDIGTVIKDLGKTGKKDVF